MLRRTYLAATLSIAACAPRATIMAPSGIDTTPGRPATSTPTVGPGAGHARWVPRVTPTAGSSFFYIPIYGPTRSHQGTAATTYLARGRVGLVVGGRRFVFEHDALTAIDPDVEATLETVTAVATALGGGFVFTAKDGLFFADTFEAPLRRLSAHSTNVFDVGPHVVFVPRDGLIATTTGKRVSTPDTITQMLTQDTSGFSVVASATTPPTAWLTTDGQTFKAIALEGATQHLLDGDGLIVATEKGILRVTRDGNVAPSSLSSKEMTSSSFRAKDDRPNPAADDGYAGALLDAGFLHTGRSPDEWYTVRNRQIWITNIRTHEMTAMGDPVGASNSSTCSAGTLDEKPHVFCFEQKKRADIYSIDLANGATHSVYSFEAKHGDVLFGGLFDSDGFPKAPVIRASCEGVAGRGMMCIRDAHGKWQNFQYKVGDLVLPFPGELITLADHPDGSVELLSVGTGLRRTFSADEVGRIQSETGEVAAVPGKMPQVVPTGVLRTTDGIRLFRGPNPLDPITKGTSFAIDYPFSSSAPLTISSIDGVVAGAGRHALRLSGGKLWETSDGWKTWNPAEPPPTGVPSDLAGAMCRDEGCVLGPWTRLGWDR